VLNQVIETVLGKGKEIVAWREQHRESFDTATEAIIAAMATCERGYKTCASPIIRSPCDDVDDSIPREGNAALPMVNSRGRITFTVPSVAEVLQAYKRGTRGRTPSQLQP
jgi:hypothetical protein